MGARFPLTTAISNAKMKMLPDIRS